MSQRQRDEIRAALNIIRDLRSAADDSMEVEWSDEKMEVESSSGDGSASAVAGVDVTRKIALPEWKNFCGNVGRKPELVTPTCVIDFPYEDAKGLKLARDKRLLERMYCFKEAEDDRRVVLHVHTLLEWGQRNDKSPSERAQKVTSVNVRHEWIGAKGSKQEEESSSVVPVGEKLKYKWRDIFRKDGGKSLEWKPAEQKSMPHIEKNDEKTKDTYNEVSILRSSHFHSETDVLRHSME